MFDMLRLFCIVLRYLTSCDGPFMFRMKVCFESDKCIQSF